MCQEDEFIQQILPVIRPGPGVRLHVLNVAPRSAPICWIRMDNEDKVERQIWRIASEPPRQTTTNTKDAQLSASPRTDSARCILDETRQAGDLFSVQNSNAFLFGAQGKKKI